MESRVILGVPAAREGYQILRIDGLVFGDNFRNGMADSINEFRSPIRMLLGLIEGHIPASLCCLKSCGLPVVSRGLYLRNCPF